MEASAKRITSRTGGVLKFRKPLQKLTESGSRVGTRSSHMMQNQLCCFCCTQRTSEQVCTARGVRGRKKEDVQWMWICTECKDKVVQGQ